VGGEPGMEDERDEEQCGAEGGDFDCAAGHVSGCKGARGKEAGSPFRTVPCRVRVLELKVSCAVRAFGPERNVRLLAKRYRQRRMERGRDVRQASVAEPFSDLWHRQDCLCY
jgi:hypothetical protein